VKKEEEARGSEKKHEGELKWIYGIEINKIEKD